MGFKDFLSLTVFSLFLAILLFGSSDFPEQDIDVNSPKAEEEQRESVSGKTALFIGDSHTANHGFGWQKILCDRTGIMMKNVSVGGKTTDWMLNQAVYSINDKIDFLFLYGGANDMYGGSLTPEQCLDNLQKIVKVAHARGIRSFVITGFDPLKVVRVERNGYKERYARLQELMMTRLQHCKVIDCREVITIEDCGDGLCHMRKSGHSKMAQKILEDLKFEEIKK